MGIAVEFCNVVKQFPDAAENAVDQVSFQVQEGELITILGTSGCGKTTLMKMVNRLYEPTSGTIKVFGEDILKMDAVRLRRKIGYVIQQVGLFPHMTVEKNIAVVPEILGWEKEKIHERAAGLLAIHKRGGLTCLFVTHDVTEALKLGTRILIMNQGKIQQFDTPEMILKHPANDYVAALIRSVTEGLNFFK